MSTQLKPPVVVGSADSTLRLLRVTGIAGIIAAIAWTIGDALLLGATADPARYSILTQYADRIDPEMAAAMLPSSTWRLAWGALSGALTVPLYLAGAWHLYQGLKPAGRWLAGPPYLLLVSSLALGPFAHGSFFFLGETYRAIQTVDPVAHPALLRMAQDFRAVLIIDYILLVVLALVGLVWMTVAIATGRTAFPRWMAITNPLVLVVLGSVSDYVLPEPLKTWLRGAGFNLGFLATFLLSTVLLWNGGQERRAIGTTPTDSGQTC